jgi:hypothetical protein
VRWFSLPGFVHAEHGILIFLYFEVPEANAPTGFYSYRSAIMGSTLVA